MQTVREAFRHNDWANARLFDFAADCTDDELDRPFEMGPGSLRRTLFHLWEAERIWLDRWTNQAPATFGTQDAALPLAEIRQRLEATAAARERFCDDLPPDGGARRVTFTTSKGETVTLPLGDTLLHVANHAIHHRAQALNMLRRLDHKRPAGLDYLFMRGECPTLVIPEDHKRAWRQRGFAVADHVSAPAAFDRDTLREYFHYSDWATARLLDAAAPLADDQLDRPFEMGLGTLRLTLTHIRDAESWWLGHWTGRGDGQFNRLPATTPLGALRDLLAETIAGRNAYLGSIDDATLLEPVTVEALPDLTITFRIGESMLQLPGHGTHHRAQALNMLRRLGAELPDINYRPYAQLKYAS